MASVLSGNNKHEIAKADEIVRLILKDNQTLSLFIAFVAYFGSMFFSCQPGKIAIYLNQHPKIRDAGLTFTGNHIRNYHAWTHLSADPDRSQKRHKEWNDAVYKNDASYRANLHQGLIEGRYIDLGKDAVWDLLAVSPSLPEGPHVVYEGDNEYTLEECLDETEET
ncbi:hypothetical protein MMC14_006839 [Varicellaria rhodocarpa]|nr:hypothetical protein [Varicellaria rhodocarpa]